MDAREKTGGTASIMATIKGQTACLQMLLDTKADIRVADNDGNTLASGGGVLWPP